jgi:hypothetical protein
MRLEAEMIDFSIRGLRTDLQVNLPFNNSMRIKFDLDPGFYDVRAAYDVRVNTHLWLLYCGASLLPGRKGQAICGLIKPWQREMDDVFHDALCLGLYDADKRPLYNDALLSAVPTWKSHFYDPDTGTNWLGETQPTAVSEGCRHYALSLQGYQDGDLKSAGYRLGLALHFLTDLTQPMHAANFTWMDSWRFGFHTDFERFAGKMKKQIELPKRYAPHLPVSDVETYFKAVARYTKDSYFALICNTEWVKQYDPGIWTKRVWQERVGGYLQPIFHDAIQTTAQFLLMWFDALDKPKNRLLNIFNAFESHRDKPAPLRRPVLRG